MLHGDISNMQRFVIGVRCEDTLIQFPKNRVRKWWSKFDKNRVMHGGVVKEVFNLINYLYWRTSYSVELIVNRDNMTVQVEDYLSDMPCRVISVDNENAITTMLNTGELSYFITEKNTDLERVSNKNCMTVKEFNVVMPRH